MSSVNSKEYWDGRFDNNWETAGGLVQTRSFIQLMINNLPNQVIEYLESRRVSVLDWGCAVGVGVQEFSERFKKSVMSGLDFSDSAIEQSKALLPQFNFVAGSLDTHKQRYDLIYTSNCLEHFKDPYEWMRQILTYTNKYAIFMVPYNEQGLVTHGEHQFSFTEKSFHPRFHGFNKVHEKIIDQCPGCWVGQQIVVVYKKQ
jgi:trans-aconitate methyltransferase